MVEKVPMTVEGHERLEAELKTLKHMERPAVIKAIEEARAHGDLSENAEYHAAKERQGFIESRIQDLEGKISRCEVIDPGRRSSSPPPCILPMKKTKLSNTRLSVLMKSMWRPARFPIFPLLAGP